MYKTAIYSDSLESSTLGLKFTVTERHFKHGNMKLKCTASISRIYTMSNEALAVGEEQAAPLQKTIDQGECNFCSSYPLLSLSYATALVEFLIYWQLLYNSALACNLYCRRSRRKVRCIGIKHNHLLETLFSILGYTSMGSWYNSLRTVNTGRDRLTASTAVCRSVRGFR